MSEEPFLRMEVDGVDATWQVVRVRSQERLHEGYRTVVSARPVDDERSPVRVAIDDLVAQTGTLTIQRRDGERVLGAIVHDVRRTAQGYELELVPPLALLAQTCDYRVFVDEDVVSIAQQVLSEHDLELDVRVRRELPRPPQTVQHFESDLAFVSRLLAREGICMFLPFDADRTVVLTDHPEGFDTAPGSAALAVTDGVASLREEEVLFDYELHHQRCEDEVSLRDYDFVRPELDQDTSAGDGTLEAYGYPGGYLEPSDGAALAAARLAQLRARAVTLTAATRCRRLGAGQIVEVEGGARDDLAGPWLIVSLQQEMVTRAGGEGTGDSYLARLEAVPADAGFWAPVPAAPSVGLQTATVTGPVGEEIYSEQHGRSTILHRWDRRREADEHSSAWARVVQPAISGSMLVPRMSWETLVAHQGGSADQPFLVGRLYNALAPPPAGLPGSKVQSHLGTLTSPGGGSANAIVYDDTAGAEGFSVTASHDFNEKTENDKAVEVTADDAHTIGANREVIAGQVHQVGISGAQSYSVGASRNLATDANHVITAASESVVIGGLRTFQVGGDSTSQCSTLTRLVGGAKMETAVESVNRVVTGASTVLTGGSWNVVAANIVATSVMAANTELVSGARSIKCANYGLTVRGLLNETLASRTIEAGGDRDEDFGAAASYSFGGSATVKGADVIIKASGSLTVKASGITLKLDPSSCTIDGDFKSSVASTDQGNEKYG